jgi:hypothetical protein
MAKARDVAVAGFDGVTAIESGGAGEGESAGRERRRRGEE